MAAKVFNFCAGPAVLPDSVLREAQSALIDWAGTGTSILSVSHRSAEFTDMVVQMKANLRLLMNLSDEFEILFLHGGASWQSVMVPANFVSDDELLNYVDTGHWSRKAIEEAKKLADVSVIASGVDAALNTQWAIDPEAAYCHFTPNETIDGVEFYDFPKSTVPLVADMSSTILSRPFDVSGLDLIYAGAQKNIGPAGMTLVIIRRSLLARFNPDLPSMLSYQTHVKAGSIYNTPATFSWYVTAEMFKWLLAEGGLPEMAKRNQHKSTLLYDFLDRSDFYINDVPKACRSWMNIPFRLADPSQDERFLREAKEAGFIGLKGHRSHGGMRASLYNPMPVEGVQALLDFMKKFESK